MPKSHTPNWPADCVMSERIRTADWSATSLGPIADWQQELKNAIDILLRLTVPAALSWGVEGIMFHNDACAAFAESLHPALLGCKLEEVWPEHRDFRECVRKVRREQRPLVFPTQEVKLRYHGEPRRSWFSLHYSPVPGKSGTPAGVLILFIETIGRAQAEQALQEREQRLSMMFRYARTGLSIFSPEGRFQRVNDELCRMLGRTREDLLRSGIQDVTHPDDLENTLKAVEQLRTTGGPVSIDKRYVRPDGTVVFANSIVSRIDSDGGPPSVLAVTIDLTERKRALDALAESEERFRALAEASPALIWQFDPHGSAVYFNARSDEILGVPREALLGTGWQAVIHPDDLAKYLQQLEQALREMKATPLRVRLKCADGEWHWMKSHAAPWFTAAGEYAGHVGITVDINDTVRAQEELSISNERLNLAIEGSGDGIWDWDMQADEIIFSQRAREILGVEELDAPIRRMDWEQRVHPQDLPMVLAGLRDCIAGTRSSFHVEYRMRRGADSWCWILSRAVIVKRGARNKALRMTGTVTDISERRRSDEVVWHHANFDTLTGLPNRRLFRDRLDHEVRKARRTGLRFALLFIDLDHFKEANDLLGHDIGDQVLVEAGKRIRNCVRQSDTVARLGGDEFTAILTELDGMAHVETIARKINEAVAAPFQIGNEVVHLSASVGITLYPDDADTAENLIRNADQAMYAAKNSGRNQFSYFTPTMQREAHDRLHLIKDLRSALARGQLKVYYQPMVDLHSGHVVKAEALLRWQHPRLGLLGPRHFIPFAEESGLIVEIGDWVFREAAASSRRWSEQLGAPFQISINKSPVQFLSRSREMDWPAYLSKMGLGGSNVAVEITEGLLLNASQNVVSKLLEYRDAGIQVALDDFGTGYSSMSYLKKFDIDYLKIDQSFIRDMVTNDGDLAIVRSVTAMAHELGLQVIAEGIETAEQNALLIDAQCDFGQGFLFSKAMPAEKFERMLRA